MAHGHTDMDRTLRGEMFIAHAIGHVATPRVPFCIIKPGA